MKDFSKVMGVALIISLIIVSLGGQSEVNAVVENSPVQPKLFKVSQRVVNCNSNCTYENSDARAHERNSFHLQAAVDEMVEEINESTNGYFEIVKIESTPIQKSQWDATSTAAFHFKVFYTTPKNPAL